MAVVKPFYCLRPAEGLAEQTAALPYDVYSRKEARRAVLGKPLSFLNIDRPETQFEEGHDMYAPEVYQKARELLDARIQDGTYVEDSQENYYIYELTMDGRSQTGIVACCSIDDYGNGVIKKHENTREEKELDRIRHVDVTDAHTGPIFLAYRANETVAELVERAREREPLFDFVSEDGIRHRGWTVDDRELVRAFEEAFLAIPATYIADGHHRAASAVKVGLKRREANPDYTGREPFNVFLSVLFSDDQLKILPYNRVVRDLNGMSPEKFLEAVRERFLAEPEDGPVEPKEKGQFGMFLDGRWYRLTAKPEIRADDPVKGLDVSILQDNLLGPVLGIGDPRVDQRIDFIGGIRGFGELERRVNLDMRVAFSMYPTSMAELLAVADAGKLMPPKSTWFEPKLRSGLFLHRLTKR